MKHSWLKTKIDFQGGGESEKFVGNEGLHSEFQITTKAMMCLKPGGSSKEEILKGWEESEKP